MSATSLDPYTGRYALRTRGMTASEIRALFAVASRPEVVSLAGGSIVSRAGLSQLSNLGLRELVAFSEDDYVKIAATLARFLLDGQPATMRSDEVREPALIA